MKKMVDLEDLAQKLANAISSSIMSLANDPSPEVKEEKAVSVKKKRGRPPKNKQVDTPTIVKPAPIIEIPNAEEVEEILSYVAPTPPERKVDPNIVQSKRVSNRGIDSIKNVGGAQAIVDSNRKIRFVDDVNVPRDPTGPKAYPDPEPTYRSPQIKQKFRCSICGRDFEAFWSEVPQALEMYKDPVSGTTERALVKCNECSGKASGMVYHY